MIKVIRIYQDDKVTELYVKPNCIYDLGKNDNGLILTFNFDDLVKGSDDITPINHSDLINNNHINVIDNTVAVTHIDDVNFEYKFNNPNNNPRDVL